MIRCHIGLGAFFSRPFGVGGAQRGEHLFALGVELAPGAGRGTRDGIGGDQWESDGSIVVDDDRVFKPLRLDLAPGNGLGGCRAGESA
ncbi:MAG: hypothetical protein ACRDHP_05210, partial [Ktedonobacterales bacterium]